MGERFLFCAINSTGRKWVPRAVLIVLLVPMVVTSTEPLPIPVNCFSASGRVLEPGETPGENYTVVLVGRGAGFSNNKWSRISHDAITITSGSGGYRLEGCNLNLPDSIATAVVLPDTIILSEPVLTSRLDQFEEKVPYTSDGLLYDDEKWRVNAYVFDHVDSLNIPVP